MLPHLSTALFSALPLVVAGIVHMLFVKLDLWPQLRIPLDERRFGANKTWRGVAVMTLATVLGVALAKWLEPAFVARAPLLFTLRETSSLVLGPLLGLAYVIAELPNSYMKRRLGIAPGLLPDQKRALFAFIDQADSAIGCMAVYAVMLRPPLPTLLVACALGPLVHLLVNVNLYLVGLRRRPV